MYLFGKKKPHEEELFQMTLENRLIVWLWWDRYRGKSTVEKNSYAVFSNCFIIGNVNVIILRFFCVFCEQYPTVVMWAFQQNWKEI